MGATAGAAAHARDIALQPCAGFGTQSSVTRRLLVDCLPWLAISNIRSRLGLQLDGCIVNLPDDMLMVPQEAARTCCLVVTWALR